MYIDILNTQCFNFIRENDMNIKEIEDLILVSYSEEEIGIALFCSSCSGGCSTSCSKGCSADSCSSSCTTCSSAGSATCNNDCSVGCSPGCAGAQSIKPCINTCTYSETREIS